MDAQDVDRLVSDARLALVNAQHLAARVAAMSPQQYAASSAGVARQVQANYVAKLLGRLSWLQGQAATLDPLRRAALRAIATMLEQARQILATIRRSPTLSGQGKPRPPRPLREAEMLSEAMEELDGEWRRPGARQRAGLPPTRERIRVERARTDRARLRKRRGERRRAQVARLRSVAPRAFRQGITTALKQRDLKQRALNRKPGIAPRLLSLFYSAAVTDFVSTMGTLMTDPDGSPLGEAVVNNAVSSAVAVAAHRAGIIDRGLVEQVAKLVSQIISASKSMMEGEADEAWAVVPDQIPLRNGELRL